MDDSRDRCDTGEIDQDKEHETQCYQGREDRFSLCILILFQPFGQDLAVVGLSRV